MARVERPPWRQLGLSWRDGALYLRRGRNVWRVTGEDAARLYAAMRAQEAKGGDPWRLLGRALHRRYRVRVERLTSEKDAIARSRAIRDDAGSADGFAAELARRIR